MREPFRRFHKMLLLMVAIVLAEASGNNMFGAAITLVPFKDNTLYESTTGTLSDGQGDFLFAGRTRTHGLRRGLLAFDIANALPANAIITDVMLTLLPSNIGPAGGSADVSLFRLLADWGEGNSKAAFPEGEGGTAQTGDATWLHTFSTTLRWTTPGGDFITQPSATRRVGPENASMSWSGAGLVSDAQFWLTNPSANFGWIIRANEVTPASAIRFNSRSNPAPATRPQLVVQYDAVPEPDPIALLGVGLLTMRRRGHGRRADHISGCRPLGAR